MIISYCNTSRYTTRVKSGAAKAGKELGQKVTYAKLEKDWKKAGEPTDVGSIAKILSDRGLTTSVGDEGGFAPKLDGTEDALRTIIN